MCYWLNKYSILLLLLPQSSTNLEYRFLQSQNHVTDMSVPLSLCVDGLRGSNTSSNIFFFALKPFNKKIHCSFHYISWLFSLIISPKNHLIVKVPQYQNQTITSPVSVAIYVVTNAGRSHDVQPFTYTPDTGLFHSLRLSKSPSFVYFYNQEHLVG